MEIENLDKIYRISADLVVDTSLDFKRYLYSQLDWDSRLVCIKGPRGVGKTTLMLQHIKESLSDDSALYVSLDNIWVNGKDIYTLAEHHLAHGGTHLFLDEVHKLEDWQDLMKSMNDNLKQLNIVYSGSIDCATISLAAGVAPITLGGVTLAQETIELIVPTSIAVGTRLITWSTPYEKTFTSASLNAAGLTLEKRDDGLYVVEQPVDLDTIFYQFSTETPTYDATKLAVSPSSMTIACSLKTVSADEALWTETLTMGAYKMTVGLMTGDSATKIKFVTSINGGAYSAPCGEIEVPYANLQTHTYLVTFNVISGSVGQWTLYVDGVKKGESRDNEYAFLYNNPGYTYTHAQTTNENVALQDGRIYTRVLNTSEIKAYTDAFPNYPKLRFAPRIIVR